MTNEELNELLGRIDHMSAQLDEIMKDIHKRQDELDDLWAQYWRAFGRLSEVGKQVYTYWQAQESEDEE